MALGGSAPIGGGMTVAAELANRRFAAGEGLGWLMELRREAEADHLFLRYVHAPGGSGAFARVRNELSGFGTRALAGGVLLSRGYWRVGDEEPPRRPPPSRRPAPCAPLTRRTPTTSR